MARSKNLDGRARRLSFRRAIYSKVNDNGITWAKTPRKTTKPPSQSQRDYREIFANICIAMKRCDAQFQNFAREATHGTWFMPRDLMMMFFAGTLPAIHLEGGGKLFSMRSRYQSSTFLDVLTQTPGSLLYRAEEWWIEVPPGNNGDVLRFRGLNEAPEWVPMPSGSPPLKTLLRRTSNQATSTAVEQLVQFQSAVYDELMIWNPATPERIVIPAGATRYKLTCGVEWTTSTTAKSYGVWTQDQAGNHLITGNPYMSVRYGTTGYGLPAYTLSGGWWPATGISWLSLNMWIFGATYTWGPTANCWAMLEVEF